MAEGEVVMAWLYLGLAAVFEVVFAVSMKQSEGFTKLWPTVLVVVGVIGGISLLTLSLRELPVSVGYPIWVGVGTVGTVALGAVMFGESVGALKLLSVGLILVGVIGLKVFGDGDAGEAVVAEEMGPGVMGGPNETIPE